MNILRLPLRRETLTTEQLIDLNETGTNWKNLIDSIMLSANVDGSEPKPCKKYAKRMLLTAKFIVHLPGCNACKKVLVQLNRESELKLRVYENDESE